MRFSTEPYHCLLGRHSILCGPDGSLLHEFLPKCPEPGLQNDTTRPPCVLLVVHPLHGQVVIMGEHKWKVEDLGFEVSLILC